MSTGTGPVARLQVRALGGAARWWRVVVLVLAGAVVVGCIAVNVVWQREDRQQRNEERAGAEALDAMEETLPKVLSYDFSALDAYRQRINDFTAGDFRGELEKLLTDKIIPIAKRNQIVTRATVADVALVEVDGEDSATVLAFVNQVTRKKGASQPTIEGSRVAVGVTKQDGEWKIVALDPV